MLRKSKLPQQLLRDSISVFDPRHDSVNAMLHARRWLEFPGVLLEGAGRIPTEDEGILLNLNLLLISLWEYIGPAAAVY